MFGWFIDYSTLNYLSVSFFYASLIELSSICLMTHYEPSCKHSTKYAFPNAP